MSLESDCVSVAFADDLRSPLDGTFLVRSVRVLFARFAVAFRRRSSTCFPRYDLPCEVYSVVLFNVRPCLYPSLRGRPRTVALRPRSGAEAPDTDKIYSIILRNPSPLHNQFHAGPRRPGQGDASSWQGAAGIRRPSGGESTLSQESLWFLRCVVVDATLQQPYAEDRATVGTDPSAASGLEEE